MLKDSHTEGRTTVNICRSRLNACIVAAGIGTANASLADDQNAQSPEALSRPQLQLDRWREDWSALADPTLRTMPFDSGKYISLSPNDPQSYLSFGLSVRERLESNDAPNFGIAGTPSDSYLLQRLHFHADLHLFDTWQAFVQIEDVRTFGKKNLTPVDENELDFRIAFLGYKSPLGPGTFITRLGRQEFAFDTQRFVSSREGPNVRQAFDAIWVGYDAAPWRFQGFISKPVVYENDEPFDDDTSDVTRFNVIRAERDLGAIGVLSGYYGFYQRDDAVFLDATGDEKRHAFDVRFAGGAGGLDWDLEAMAQLGTIGGKDIRAWAAGARMGYTFSEMPWRPRIGLQFDAASGDRRAGDDTLGTFNGLFSNGSYFSLAGYTTYANLIHVKPSLTVHPTASMKLSGEIGFQWRESIADAVYVAPNIALPGTAGVGDHWTGHYARVRVDWAINTNVSAVAEYVHFEVGDTIQTAGGHDSDYLGLQLRIAW